MKQEIKKFYEQERAKAILANDVELYKALVQLQNHVSAFDAWAERVVKEGKCKV